MIHLNLEKDDMNETSVHLNLELNDMNQGKNDMNF